MPSESMPLPSQNLLKDFQPFIITGNLPLELQPHFIPLLEYLSEKTGHLWKPGNCSKSALVGTFIELYLEENGLNTIKADIEGYQTQHAWSVLITLNQKNKVIIDPFGVMETTQGRIIPHFGALTDLLTLSDEYPQAIEFYSNGRILNPLEKAMLFIKG